MSGGVDSSVCCALLHKAIGVDRVVAVHIDNGFLRKNESATVKESLEKIDLNLTGKQIFFISSQFIQNLFEILQ